MERAVIDLENVQTVRIGFGKLIQEHLVALTIDMRELQKELLSGGRFHRPIEPKRFELPLPSAQRFDAQTRAQASDDGLQSKPTFVLGKVAKARTLWFGNCHILFKQTQVVAEVC